MERKSVSSWIPQILLTIAVGIVLLSSNPLHAQVDTGASWERSQTHREQCLAGPL